MCQIYGRCMSTSINLTTTNLCDYSHKSIPLFFFTNAIKLNEKKLPEEEEKIL